MTERNESDDDREWKILADMDGVDVKGSSPQGRIPDARIWLEEVDGRIHIHEDHPDGGHICLLQWTPDQAKESAKLIWEYQKLMREKNTD